MKLCEKYFCFVLGKRRGNVNEKGRMNVIEENDESLNKYPRGKLASKRYNH